MGEAKKRRLQNMAIAAKAQQVDFGRVANAVNRLTLAASENVGADCILQAALAQSILSALSVPSELCLGFAAWRVGQGDGDVISHIPQKGMEPATSRHFAMHAWLRVGDRIFDVTTAQLPLKAAQLDAQDGGSTQVDWAPAFVLAPLSEVSSYRDVAQGHAGQFFYKYDPALTAHLLTQMPMVLDPIDVANAWLIYENPDVNVIGPNQVRITGSNE